MQTLQNQTRWFGRIQWVLAGTLFVVVVAFYLLGYRPHTATFNELARQIRDRERDLQACRSQTRVLPEVAAQVQRMRERLESSRKRIPEHSEMPQFIRDVTQLSEQAQLKISYKPDAVRRGELVHELPIEFTLEGDFVSVYAFLRNTEEMDRLTRIRRMTIKNRNKTGQVHVQLAMNIYYAGE